MRRPRHGRDALLGTGLLLLLLACGELAARRAWGPPEDRRDGPGSDFEYLNVDVRRPFFSLGPDLRYHAARPRSLPVSFAALKRAGQLRVFVYGGSVSMPFADRLKTRLADTLMRALPGRDVEVLGAGMGAYDSEREVLVQEELLRRSPDLLVLLSGHNEYLQPIPPVHPAAFALDRFLRRSALYDGLQRRLRPREEGPGRLTLDERERRFEDNIALMLRRAREAGVPMVLCTLPVNARDIAPAFTVPSEDPGFRRARDVYEGGETREARRLLRAFAAAHPGDAHAFYWLARAEERAGDLPRARAAYGRAVDLEDPGDRCPPRRNAAIRRIAADEGAALADLDAAFAAASGDGLPDRRFFKDGVHFFDEWYPPRLPGDRGGRRAAALRRTRARLGGGGAPPPLPAVADAGERRPLRAGGLHERDLRHLPRPPSGGDRRLILHRRRRPRPVLHAQGAAGAGGIQAPHPLQPLERPLPRHAGPACRMGPRAPQRGRGLSTHGAPRGGQGTAGRVRGLAPPRRAAAVVDGQASRPLTTAE